MIVAELPVAVKLPDGLRGSDLHFSVHFMIQSDTPASLGARPTLPYWKEGFTGIFSDIWKKWLFDIRQLQQPEVLSSNIDDQNADLLGSVRALNAHPALFELKPGEQKITLEGILRRAHEMPTCVRLLKTGK